MENITNFINGEYVEPLTDKYLDVFEPATGDENQRHLRLSGEKAVKTHTVGLPSAEERPVEISR